MVENEITPKNFHRTDHLANQRTFLAWIRTNLGIMAFGFVVERFSFFTQKVATFLTESGLTKGTETDSLNDYSFGFGITIIAIGAILNLFAFIKYKKTQQQINQDIYKSSILLNLLLTLFVVIFGAFLITYLALTAKF